MAVIGTRRFLDDIRTDIDTNDQYRIDNIYTNTDESISGDTVGVWMQAAVQIQADMLRSLADSEALLSGSTTTSFPITDTWVNLSDALLGSGSMFDIAIGDDSAGEGFLKIDMPSGTITGKDVAGYTYNAIGALGVDAGTNEVIEVAIGLNGSPNTAFVGSVIGTGGVREQSVYVERYTLSAPANAVYSLMVRAPDGAATIQVTPRNWGLAVKPTDNP